MILEAVARELRVWLRTLRRLEAWLNPKPWPIGRRDQPFRRR